MADSRPTQYFIYHYRILRFLGLGWWHQPEEGKTENFQGWYFYYCIFIQIAIVTSFVIMETIDPFKGDKDKDRFMFCISFVITHDLTLLKMYIFVFKNLDIQDIVRTLEIDMYDYYQNIPKNRKTVKISKIITGSFIFFGWMTILNGNVYGAVQDLKWKALVGGMNDSSLPPVRTLPQPIYIPWNYQKDFVYIPTFILEDIGLLWTGHIILTIDTFIASVILHMSSQFETLYEAVTTAYDRTMMSLREGIHPDAVSSQNRESPRLLNEEEINEDIVIAYISREDINAALRTTFRNCFRQHQVLINCVEKFAKTYSLGFMTQLLSSTAAICVVMVQLSEDVSGLASMKLMTSVAFFFAMIIQLGMQCFTSNELSLRAENISDAVMQCKWERIPASLRPPLVMMMMRAQKPLRLTAAGFTQMDNACFLAGHSYLLRQSRDPGKRLPSTEVPSDLHDQTIMKAAYSYYAVLSQKQE